ncbi:hypothetical protein Ccrd_016661 [Cynara cardunculus var. scolymus]|uniref:Uncharacterized protein n=1 Tax=Cynara cardunculus var. scolymus TaxID=59895 RepID=A0A103Y9J5_CYNCS|nr:hypothetical protein Ccrd_016661 [Cynara cardunculus var. scolymus]
MKEERLKYLIDDQFRGLLKHNFLDTIYTFFRHCRPCSRPTPSPTQRKTKDEGALPGGPLFLGGTHPPGPLSCCCPRPIGPRALKPVPGMFGGIPLAGPGWLKYIAELGGVPIFGGNLGPDGPPGGTPERPGGTPGQTTGGENGGIKTAGDIGGPGPGDMLGVSGCNPPGGGIPSGPKASSPLPDCLDLPDLRFLLSSTSHVSSSLALSLLAPELSSMSFFTEPFTRSGEPIRDATYLYYQLQDNTQKNHYEHTILKSQLKASLTTRVVKTSILEDQSAKITISGYDIIRFFFLTESVTFISRFIFCGFPDQTRGYQETMHSTE